MCHNCTEDGAFLESNIWLDLCGSENTIKSNHKSRNVQGFSLMLQFAYGILFTGDDVGVTPTLVVGFLDPNKTRYSSI